jgi:hypothetical protein
MSEDGGPQLFRPIARRPFELGLMSPTPPDDDSAPPSPTSNANANANQGPSLLDPRAFAGPAGDSISRAASYKNLTSSTLAGIYSHNVSGYPAGDNVYGSEPPDTPWGTGAETPATAARGSVDESIYRLVKDRSSLLKRRRSSALSARSARSGNSLQQQQGSPTQTALSLALRTAFLFVLGLGYGAILSRLSTEQQWASFPVEGIIRHRYDSAYLACWGVFGVALGSLLPWFDGKWEQAFEKVEDEAEEDFKEEEEDPGTDWALVVRGVGAFVGIVFAIVGRPPPPSLRLSLRVAQQANTSTEKGPLGIHDAGLHDSVHGQSIPVVLDRQVKIRVPAVRRRGLGRLGCPGGAQPRHCASTIWILLRISGPEPYGQRRRRTADARWAGHSEDHRDGDLGVERAVLQLCLLWEHRQAAGSEQVSSRSW